MNDLELQVKITSQTSEAVKSVKSLGEAFKEIGRQATLAGKAMQSFRFAGEAISKLSSSLDAFSKASKKFGRDFTQNVTLPIAGLATLALKKVFDEAYFGRGSAATNRFAGEVQALKKQFDALLISIGTQLAPVATKVVGFFQGLIASFRSLSPETQKLILNFALIAGAVGPIVLAISTLASIVAKLLVVLVPVLGFFGKIAGFFTSTAGVVVILVGTLAGLVNVFFKLREAGVATAQALLATFNLFVTGFNNYVTKNILKGVQLIIDGINKLLPAFNFGLKQATSGASQQVGVMIKTLEERFDSNKGAVDAALAKIGSSAGKAFTFGLSESISDALDVFNKFSAGTGQVVTVMANEIKEKAREIGMSISGGLADAFLDIASGAKTAEAAFADFARSTIRNLSQMILQAQLFRLLFPAGGAGAAGAGAVAGASTVPTGFATGGFVSGPGTGTSDSILARLSNGEFVNDAKTVKTFGVDFFRNLKSMSRGGVPTRRKSGSIPGFADGGLVGTGAGGSAPQVIIQNSGSPKESGGTSYDPSTAVTTVILEDIQKNGSISKSMQRTFAFRRAGFR